MQTEGGRYGDLRKEGTVRECGVGPREPRSWASGALAELLSATAPLARAGLAAGVLCWPHVLWKQSKSHPTPASLFFSLAQRRVTSLIRDI